MKLDQVQLGRVAARIRDRIKRAIDAAPGDRWNRTGQLLSSIRSIEDTDGSAAVTVAPDRLQSDALAKLFADEIIPPDLDERTRQEIAKAVHDAINIGERK